MDALTLVIWEKAASVVVVLYSLASACGGWRRKERKLLGWKKIDTEGRNIARHKMNGARADLISSVTSPILDEASSMAIERCSSMLMMRCQQVIMFATCYSFSLFREEKTNPNNLYQPDLSTHAIKEKATATSMKKTCWLILQDDKIFL